MVTDAEHAILRFVPGHPFALHEVHRFSERPRLAEHHRQLADIVEDARRERVFRPRRARFACDGFRDEPDAHTVRPKQVLFETFDIGDLEGIDDGRGNRYRADGAHAQQNHGFAHVADAARIAVVGGVRKTQELGGERLVGADYGGEVHRRGTLVFGKLNSPRGHALEGRELGGAVHDHAKAVPCLVFRLVLVVHAAFL